MSGSTKGWLGGGGGVNASALMVESIVAEAEWVSSGGFTKLTRAHQEKVGKDDEIRACLGGMGHHPAGAVTVVHDVVKN